MRSQATAGQGLNGEMLEVVLDVAGVELFAGLETNAKLRRSFVAVRLDGVGQAGDEADDLEAALVVRGVVARQVTELFTIFDLAPGADLDVGERRAVPIEQSAGDFAPGLQHDAERLGIAGSYVDFAREATGFVAENDVALFIVAQTRDGELAGAKRFQVAGVRWRVHRR